jgi:competence protein ComGB
LQQVLGAKVKNQLEKGTEIKAIIESEAFISNNLVMLLETWNDKRANWEKSIIA